MVTKMASCAGQDENISVHGVKRSNNCAAITPLTTPPPSLQLQTTRHIYPKNM